MDPFSQTCKDEEECQSSESGWTMYIGTPSHHDGGDDSDDGHDSSSKNNDNDDDDDDDGDNDDDDDDDDDDDGKEINREDESDDSMASDASSGPSFRGYDSRDNVKKQVGSFNKEKKGGSESRSKVRKNIRLNKRK